MASLEARLIALEQARDAMIDRIFDQAVARERVLLGDRFREYNDALVAGRMPAAELVSTISGDSEMQRLDAVYGRLEQWRECVEKTIPSARRRRDTGG